MKSNQKSSTIPTRGQASPEELRKFWQHHVDCWESSGQSQTEYCCKQRISLCRFSYWRRKFVKGDDPVEIVMLPTHITNQAGFAIQREVAEPLRLMVDGRVAIDIPEHFSSSALEKIRVPSVRL